MSSVTIQLIGIYCATEAARIGLAWGTAEGPELRILQAQQCSSNKPAARTVAQWVNDSPHAPILEQSADALDAALCLVAAHDFLLGRAIAPSNLELAKREGWIWARHRSERKQPYV